MSKWFECALIRAIRTWAQAALATIGTEVTLLQEVNWMAVVSAATLAAVISLLMSVAGLPEVDLYYANLDAAGEADAEESENEDDEV